MARQHYSVAEVEALIPSLERIFTAVLQLRVGLRAVEQKLERAGVTVDIEDGSLADDLGQPPKNSEPADVRHARAVFRGFYEALSDGLEQIRAIGGDVKDLDLGLVDFPGRLGDDDVLLCWKLGEKRIEYWHTTEGGFASRRPLDERIPRTPSRLE
jgi:hypothetical protein